jgi:hypothetical protein
MVLRSQRCLERESVDDDDSLGRAEFLGTTLRGCCTSKVMISRLPQRLIHALAITLVLIQAWATATVARAHVPSSSPTAESVGVTVATNDLQVHDELRCALCQFASAQAETLPMPRLAAPLLQQEPVTAESADHVDIRYQISPPSRAPPALFA